jgi:hypothetical protein
MVYFNGLHRVSNLVCGGGEFLYINENHFFKIKMGLGLRTNNYVELIPLKLLLHFLGKRTVGISKFLGLNVSC